MFCEINTKRVVRTWTECGEPPRLLSGKESPCQCRRCRRQRFDPSLGMIPWSRKWQPTPTFLPGKFHGQRNLVGSSPWGRKELGKTEQLRMHRGTEYGNLIWDQGVDIQVETFQGKVSGWGKTSRTFEELNENVGRECYNGGIWWYWMSGQGERSIEVQISGFILSARFSH